MSTHAILAAETLRATCDVLGATDDRPTIDGQSGIGEGNRMACKDEARRIEVPSHTPRWITPELIAETIATWQPHYEAKLTEEDALEIILNVSRLADVLDVNC